MAIKMNKVTKSKKALRFDDLIIGDIFMDSIGNWYMQLYDIYDNSGNYEGNAIRLDSGEIANFDDTETVIKLKKDLIIDYSNDDITEWCE